MTGEKRWRPSVRFGRIPVSDEYKSTNEYLGDVAQVAAKPQPENTARNAAIAVAVLVVIVLALYVFLTGDSLPVSRQAPEAQGASFQGPDDFDTQPLTDDLHAGQQDDAGLQSVMPTAKPNQQELEAMDIGGEKIRVDANHENLNLPGMIYGEMVYSAGTGTARLPVLKDLFFYDMESGEETKIAEASVKNGEIFETVLSQRWFVYIDTNQSGSNQICYIDRFSENPEVMLVKETAYALPKLRLYDDYLVWIEQTDQGTDEVWFFELGTADNFPVTTLTDANTYGVSAPSIHGPEIIWAAPDPDQTPEERALGEKSAIYVCDIRELGADEVIYEYFSADMYVHEPITNGEAWAWIDKNWAPDNGLYFKYRNGSNVIQVSQGVTSYAFGDDILVYAKNMQIWVYFYKTNTYARLTAPDEEAMLPVVSGRHVVWYDLSGDTSVDKLVYREILLPGETSMPAPTPKPTPTPRPSVEEIVIIDIDDAEDGGQTPNPSGTPTPG
ncbi:MAG: hypothetical protein ACOX8S_03960 [Christensenellales bacterium]|jgi:hypothetical protein